MSLKGVVTKCLDLLTLSFGYCAPARRGETCLQTTVTGKILIDVSADGAPWIAQQSSQCLNAGYLVDFYHVCDYLAAASTAAATHQGWLEVQKERLKNWSAFNALLRNYPLVKPKIVHSYRTLSESII